MANRTVKDAKSVKGTNPQYLIEKIIRSRIYDSRFWKEECFALTAELLVDKAMELKFVGGVFGGNIKPTPFLCLTLKMLQIQPEKDIVVEFIKNEQFKYVRILGAFYMRLVGTSLDIYKYLEPLLNDYRKIRRQNRQGVYEMHHVDEFIDELLREERCCDVILPRIQKRHVLEENNELEPRVSALEDDMEEMESSSDEEEIAPPVENSPKQRGSGGNPGVGGYRDLDKPRRSPSPRFRRSRSRERERDRGEKERDRDRRGHSPERQDKKRRRSRSRERRHRSQSPSSRHHHRDATRKHKEKDRDREKTTRDKTERKDRDRKHRDDRKRDGRKSGTSGGTTRDMEIAETNALRAQLGLPPLRP